MYTSGYIPPDTSQRIFPLQFATQGSDETARREWQWSLKKAKLRQLQAGVDAMSAADGGEEAAASAETHLSLVAKIINNLQAKKKKRHTHTQKEETQGARSALIDKQYRVLRTHTWVCT